MSRLELNEAPSLFDVETEGWDRFATAAHVEAMADYELLEHLLRMKVRDPKGLGKRLLVRFGGITELIGARTEEIMRVPGMNAEATEALKIAFEFAVRSARAKVARRPVISSWSALLAYARLAMQSASREQFRVMFLDKKNQLIADEVMHEGTVDHAPVYPREVMRRALELGASAVILAHNHPSGDPTPSAADVAMTKLVAEAGKVMHVAVHDHIIIGREGVASLKALGQF